HVISPLAWGRLYGRASVRSRSIVLQSRARRCAVRLVSFEVAGGPARLGALVGSKVIDLASVLEPVWSSAAPLTDARSLLAAGPAMVEKVGAVAEAMAAGE